ncbi:MAG: CoA transferase [Thermoanaerobaculia bacterium]|nr:CoA transferase [Thermoanaerobaculia bacterium]
MNSALPLAGTVVLDVSRMLPGAVLVRNLVDLGARVIKVEDPHSGDPMRITPPLAGGTGVGFLAFFRGVESVAVDLKSTAGAAALRKMVRHADVLLESFRPGTLERWDLGYERLSAQNPGLVVVSLSSFGSEGPDAGRIGHDLNFTALTGFLAELPEGDLPRVQVADVGAGLLAVSSTLAALLQRARTGRGVHVEQPLVGGTLPFLAWAFAELGTGGGGVLDGILAGKSPGYRTYRCADGARVALGAIEPKFWAALCEMAGIPEHGGDGLDTGEAGADAARRLGAVFASRPRADWLTLADALGIPLSPVNDLASAREDLASRMERTSLPGGGNVATPAAFLGLPGLRRPHAPAPALGADTGRVLHELGFTAEEIAAVAG